MVGSLLSLLSSLLGGLLSLLGGGFLGGILGSLWCLLCWGSLWCSSLCYSMEDRLDHESWLDQVRVELLSDPIWPTWSYQVEN